MNAYTGKGAVKGFVTVEVEAKDEAEAIAQAVEAVDLMRTVRNDEIQTDQWASEVEK